MLHNTDISPGQWRRSAPVSQEGVGDDSLPTTRMVAIKFLSTRKKWRKRPHLTLCIHASFLIGAAV